MPPTGRGNVAARVAVDHPRVFLVLLVVAFFVVDAIARGVARDEVESRLVSALGLPPGTPVEVEVGGGPCCFSWQRVSSMSSTSRSRTRCSGSSPAT